MLDVLGTCLSRLLLCRKPKTYAYCRGLGRTTWRGSGLECGQGDRGSDAWWSDAADGQFREWVIKDVLLYPSPSYGALRVPGEFMGGDV